MPQGWFYFASIIKNRWTNYPALVWEGALISFPCVLSRRIKMNFNKAKTHCKNGHRFTKENTYAYKGDRHCRQCRYDRLKAQNLKTRNNFEWRKKNSKRISKLRRKRLLENPVTSEQRRRWTLHSLGWTIERFNSAWKKQKGLCAICGRKMHLGKMDNLRACADHEHTAPPKPRDILCGNCNLGIGNLQENIEIMKAAIAYVEKWSNLGA
jgi:Zn finger protein HypA/HybF involved in hydrogenase expression